MIGLRRSGWLAEAQNVGRVLALFGIPLPNTHANISF